MPTFDFKAMVVAQENDVELHYLGSSCIDLQLQKTLLLNYSRSLWCEEPTEITRPFVPQSWLVVEKKRVGALHSCLIGIWP